MVPVVPVTARRIFLLATLLALPACSPGTARPVAGSTDLPTARPSTLVVAPISQDAVPGPAGMTLKEEIGAVMMVGFRGPVSDAVLRDWRAHQFGGLLIVPINENAQEPRAIQGTIESVRGVMRHLLLVATDQEGGSVCLPASRVACMAGAREAGAGTAASVEAEMRAMSSGLGGLGFNVNFAPVADLWDGVHAFMRERSYGQDPQAVGQRVAAAVAGIHQAGLLAAAKHFPGHGAADGDSHQVLPLVSLPAETLKARDWLPFKAAAAAGVDFIMVGHLNVPSLDAAQPSSMSPVVLDALRHEIGYRGVVISDDLQMGALGSAFPAEAAAVRFLQNGGDMVIVSHDIAVANSVYDAIHDAVVSDRYPRAQLDAAVDRILKLQLGFSR